MRPLTPPFGKHYPVITKAHIRRGEKAQGPHKRLEGTGWVAEKPGDYASALAKGHGVLLMGCESTGALFTAFALLLRTLGKASTAPGTHDSTVLYGSSRASPKGFFAHHAAAISAAVTQADAAVILTTPHPP